MPVLDYTGKIVLITGIGAVGDGYGNGTAMAAAMARQGASIFGCDINLEAANRARDNINNEDEVKHHAAVQSGRSATAVEVFQQSTVRRRPHSPATS
jgi:NAD(P)-dependent dehydrogenase (short-subunit alcohol dehydrogenase family)